MSAATPAEKTSWIVPQMKAPLIVSLVFHLGVFVFTLVGIPYVKPQVEVQEEAIIVEMMEIAEETQTNREPAQTETRREIENAPEEPEEEAPPKPVAPTVTAKAPPRPVAPEVPELSVPAPPEEETKPEPEPPQVKPNRKPEVAEKPEPVKEPEDEPEEETTDDDFQGLLRNLKEAEAQQASEQNDAQAVKEKPSLMTRLSSKMTMSEVNALRQQLAQCWSLLAGARYAENLVVDMKLFMNPDRTVREARIIDQSRYNRDNYFRAAADSALRAVHSPQCSPLKLPPDKYDLWKEIIVKFDPRSML